jgi:hypothetical protein
MSNTGHAAHDARDFVTPAEGGAEFDALVGQICAEADAADVGDRLSSCGPGLAALGAGADGAMPPPRCTR